MKGESRSAPTSSRTLFSTSEKGRKSIPPASAPSSRLTWARRSSFLKMSIPQSVWWMMATSRVPRSRCEMMSERSASCARPPALRMTCASPSSSPSTREGRMRASMQVTIATLRFGGIGSPPFWKLLAYCVFASTSSSMTVIGDLRRGCDPTTPRRAEVSTAVQGAYRGGQTGRPCPQEDFRAHDPSRRVPLRRRAVSRRHRPFEAGHPVQLLHLLAHRHPALLRAGGLVCAGEGRGFADRLPVQEEEHPSPVLQGVRRAFVRARPGAQRTDGGDQHPLPRRRRRDHVERAALRRQEPVGSRCAANEKRRSREISISPAGFPASAV